MTLIYTNRATFDWPCAPIKYTYIYYVNYYNVTLGLKKFMHVQIKDNLPFQQLPGSYRFWAQVQETFYECIWELMTVSKTNLTKVRPLCTLSHRGSDNSPLQIVFK